MRTSLLPVEGLLALRASNDPHALLDIREYPEAHAGHIPRASVLPLRLLEFRIEALVPDVTCPVIVYGGPDERAACAAQSLRRLGYLDVSLLAGGFEGWVEHGQPADRGRNVPSKRFGERLLEQDAVPLVSVRDLRAWQEQGRTVVLHDVRTPGEHAREHIPSATNAPGFDVLAAAAARRDPDMPIVVHCTGRTRSIVGAQTLRLAGFENVFALENGTMGQLLAGLDVERGVPRPASPGDDDAGAAVRLRRLAQEAGVRVVEPAAGFEDAGGVRYRFDVRSRSEFDAGHLPGFRHVTGGQLVQQLDDNLGVWTAAVTLACDGGARSLATAYWLRRLGIEPVEVVRGGPAEWIDAGVSLEAGSSDPPMALGLAEATAGVPSLSPADAAAFQARGAVTISVDDSERFAVAHLPQARWLSRSWLELEAPRLFPDRSTSLVVSCHDGQASTLAAAALVRAGYEDVHVVSGGVQAWSNAGLPVDDGRGDLPPVPDDVLPHPIAVGPQAMQAYLDWEVDLDA